MNEEAKPVPTISIPRAIVDPERGELLVHMLKHYDDFRVRVTDEMRVEVTFEQVEEL